jgi:hypothetical protein
MTPATSRAKTGRSVQPAHNGECSILNAGSMPPKYPRTYVNIRLEQVAHTARKAAETVYRREFGLDTFQIRIFRVVHTKTLQPVSEIAKIANRDRTFVSRMMSSSLVLGSWNAPLRKMTHGKFLPKLTPAGQPLARRANKLGDALNKDLLSVLNSREREYLQVCLVKLSKCGQKIVIMRISAARRLQTIYLLAEARKP